MKNIFKTFSILLALTLIVSSCNTIRGIGKDVEGAGEAMQRID